ncbi:MAG: YfhO family protein, partial [Dehalococcoidia bacterium]
IVLTLALYTAYWVWEMGKRVNEERGNEVSLLCPLVNLLACLLIAFGVAALTIIPSYEMAKFTIRAQIGYEEASQYSLPPTALIGLLIPGFFGRGPANYWGPWPRVEVGYIGILPLVLALLAILLRRDRLVAFLLGLALISLLLAMGNYTILHGWLYRFVPGFGSLRAPARFVYLFDFALATLAAFGLDALLRPLSIAKRATLHRLLRLSLWAFILTALLTLPLSYLNILKSRGLEREALGRMVAANNGLVFFLIMLAGSLALIYARRHRWASPQAIGLLAVALIALDLFSMGAYTEIERRDPTANFHHPAAIAFLKADQSYYRIDTRTEVWDVWQPNLSLIQDIFDVWGIYNPSVLDDYHRYWEGLGSRSTPLYDFLNAKYIVGHKDVPLDWEKYVLAFDGDPQVNIYRNIEVLPRAFIVHRAQVVPDHEMAFAAIHQPGFDPAEAVVVEGGRELAGPPQAEDAVEIIRYSPNEIELEAITPAEGYLVLSEVYYPGWKAFVDGREEKVLRANFAFRTIYLQPGSHRVRLVFDPLSWRVGLGISFATWLGLAGWGAWGLRRRLFPLLKPHRHP